MIDEINQTEGAVGRPVAEIIGRVKHFVAWCRRPEFGSPWKPLWRRESYTQLEILVYERQRTEPETEFRILIDGIDANLQARTESDR